MEATANAVFSDRTRGTKKIAKTLRKTKLRPALLDVTIVATFVDEYASNTITFRGHRYTLQAGQILAAEKVERTPAVSSKR